MNTAKLLPAAILWDMDGTLIDTEPYWIQSEIEVTTKYGGTWTVADGMRMVGNSLEFTTNEMIKQGAQAPREVLALEVMEFVERHLRAEIPWQPDAYQLMEQVVALNIPRALVTMSYRRLAESLLTARPELFQVSIAGDEVRNSKPDPECYLTAAERLGVDIKECVAIEDSPAGLSSAHASGALTIGIQRAVELPRLPGVIYTTDLREIDLYDLGEQIASRATSR